MDINVLFFGVLADVTKTTAKHYSNIRSFGELRLRIEDEFPELVHYSFRIAVNNELADVEPVIKNGDEIAYLPPFAGG